MRIIEPDLAVVRIWFIEICLFYLSYFSSLFFFSIAILWGDATPSSDMIFTDSVAEIQLLLLPSSLLNMVSSMLLFSLLQIGSSSAASWFEIHHLITNYGIPCASLIRFSYLLLEASVLGKLKLND
ncbi:hypothetical protein V6N12_037578 [Hibiscus sabdariffa]|uniref:Uncharacterized protein n=1 Tax=Hibiscus sabdariffa TaxID=183260 RepID=A0ABR2C186_9ROSI